MGEAAREEARLAVKLEPNSALAEKTLADVLEYDLVGRKLRPGSDYDGAAAALRAATKLDPDDKNIQTDLAVLLEYDKDGMRYSSGAKLKKRFRNTVKSHRKNWSHWGWGAIWPLLYFIPASSPKPVRLLTH